MPVPLQRDPDLTRAVLTHWFGTRSAEIGAVELGPVTVPKEAGFSGEILLFDAEWTEAGTRRRRALAARVAPTRHRVFPEDFWDDQVRLLRLLGDTGLPVPRVLWDEPSAAYLGAPFLVMERVDGQVPADLPSYHRQGWLTRLPPADRAAVWNAGVDVLAAVHRLDPKETGAGFLDRPEFGPTGSAQLLGHFTHHLDFYGVADDNTAAAAALDWLRAHVPDDEGPVSLLWGDARIGNIVYAGTRPAALLDWEMAALGPAEADLAWYLHMDRHLSEGIGAPRLPGLPGRAETVARWEERVGRTARDLPYHEVFAAYRFCVVTARVARLLDESGILPPGTDFPLHRNATALLAKVLEENAQGASSRGYGPALQRRPTA
ncbi:phosphotransferase family protein [Streptomyces capillispiralis]|uniref:Aminoglycoside phosphotransferase (APT) family kinase protein n=1 Tax=Streptomyces capillispiralis TaxID=68182 RepID=A0A561TPC8_9ACTN|nr:phosphotransferase family protein [Streptomyces capillispiralis]TWF88950.1 aminoglycoside phosphotransferase (APT) family kinase protein [Streptomyces capillispiralis]GHH93219.1 putative phosphotransferase [Streptomyces capillispiralis]